MFLDDNKIADAIKMLNSITPEYASYTSIQFRIADISLQADANKMEPFQDAAHGEKAPIPYRERGLAALQNIKEPPAEDLDQTRQYWQARIRLGMVLYNYKRSPRWRRSPLRSR